MRAYLTIAGAHLVWLPCRPPSCRCWPEAHIAERLRRDATLGSQDGRWVRTSHTCARATPSLGLVLTIVCPKWRSER
jgi:hypothetical protein